jgi:S-DNA-T family DNA segregation ATPase FtsK/SpoIIIE
MMDNIVEEYFDLQRMSAPEPLTDKQLVEAIRLIVADGTGKPAVIQRGIGIAYFRAQRLLDAMESMGLVGPVKKDGSRDILVTSRQIKTIFRVPNH